MTRHNPNRILRLSFICGDCNKLHEVEGEAFQILNQAAELMYYSPQSGCTIVDATLVKMLDADAAAEMRAGEVAYGSELNRIFKEG